jgi:hypothetical protein
MDLTKKDIDRCMNPDVWSTGNDVLYNLCEEHPNHKKPEDIIAKIWLIGRSYAAAIERRRPKEGEQIGDKYYTKRVVPVLIKSELDHYLNALHKLPALCGTAIGLALETHAYLTFLFKQISDSEKRSLASKYLHFHLPAHFFLFDNRAQQGLRLIQIKINEKNHKNGIKKYDKQYEKHFTKMLALKRMIQEKYGVDLTPRELDRLLLFKVATNV